MTSLASQINEHGYKVPMLDARRMEVYTAIFEGSKQIEETSAKILDEQSFASYLKEAKVFFIGDGVQKFAEICKHDNAVFIEGKLPSANELCVLSYEKFKTQDFEDVAYFEPYYLKDLCCWIKQ